MTTFLHANEVGARGVDDPFASRAVPMHALLNPDAVVALAVAPFVSGSPVVLLTPTSTSRNINASNSSSSSRSTAIAPAAQPKRRGRKPHLPKMTNSERGKYYRSKHKRYDETLTKSVGLLRARVERLRAVKDICCDLSLSTRMNVSLPGPLVRFVREYATQFRHGVQLPPAQRNMALADVEVSSAQQEVFMRAVMEPDVGFGEYRGIATIMDQWTRYSQYHALLVWELLSVEISGSESAPIVSTSALLRTRYSRKTIENVFPHVADNEPLIQRLIGREVVYASTNRFFFNAAGRVERYDVEADFVGALVSALSSAEDAALLLGQALIQQHHMMGALDDDSDDYGYSSSTSGSNHSYSDGSNHEGGYSSSDAHYQPPVHYRGDHSAKHPRSSNNYNCSTFSDDNNTSDDSDVTNDYYANYSSYAVHSSQNRHPNARKLEVEYLLDADA